MIDHPTPAIAALDENNSPREVWLALAKECEKNDIPDELLRGRHNIYKLPLAWRIMRACGYTPHNNGDDWEKGSQVFHGSAITISVDAIAKLVETELHLWIWNTSRIPKGPYESIGAASIRSIMGKGGFVSTASTPALALCAAFCKVMAENASPQRKDANIEMEKNDV